MKRLEICVSVFAVVGVLAGCGGGSGIQKAGNGGSFDKSAAIRLTGSTAPQETAADQDARSAAILRRSDGAVATFYGETDNPNAPVFNGSCRGATCRVREPRSGETITVSLDGFSDVESSVDSSKAVLTRNDITLVEGRGGTDGKNYRGYGAWMNHSAFGVDTEMQTTADNGTTVVLRGAVAGGDATRSRPDANATWRGVMVGTPARGKFRNNILQGDAELTYTASDEQIDARFSDIKDLDRQAPHSASEVRFENVPVGRDGTYRAGVTGNRIEGGFAGPDQAETVGIFEQRGIVGAYGAKRQ